ncbi:MAG: hypothetical protein ACRYF3_17410 [Janthinobacterium lividum]
MSATSPAVETFRTWCDGSFSAPAASSSALTVGWSIHSRPYPATASARIEAACNASSVARAGSNACHPPAGSGQGLAKDGSGACGCSAEPAERAGAVSRIAPPCGVPVMTKDPYRLSSNDS